MRALVIGAGPAGTIHTRALADSGVAVSVHDLDMERATRLASASAGMSGSVVAEPDRTAPGYDLAVVAVPAPSHRALVEEQRALGRIVVCEKPLALYPEDAAALAQMDGLFIAESQCYAGDDSLRVAEMAERVARGDFGAPIIWHLVAQTTFRPQAWFDDLAIGGGAFIEGGIHVLTTARVLFGEAVAWHGAVRHFGGRGPDSGTFCVEYERGDMLTLSLYWGTEGCFAGTASPLPVQAAMVTPTTVQRWWAGDDHTAMWRHLLRGIAGEAQPVATLAHAAGAVADAWKCYEDAGVAR